MKIIYRGVIEAGISTKNVQNRCCKILEVIDSSVCNLIKASKGGFEIMLRK